MSAIQAVTDWVCAGVPCYIVSKLQMPRRRKISVICILGLGVTASVATLVRMPYLKYYNTAKYPKDLLCMSSHPLAICRRFSDVLTLPVHVGVIVMCSSAECSLGIIACSLPPLHKLIRIYYENWSSYRRGAQVRLRSLATEAAIGPHRI